MTLDDFLAEFADAAKGIDWHLGAEGGIRDEANRCPIWCLYDAREPCSGATIVATAGINLGLSDTTVRRIIDAADNREGHDPGLRRRLLEAVGLAPEEGGDRG